MAWLAGYTYRKSVTVTNASASYQTKVLVGESAGATGEEVDCNSHCQTDFDDLRFTGADGTTLLDYWIESITGTTPNQLATVWVENNATPDTTLYMYYGKADATAVSNGANTFITFDNFEYGANGETMPGNAAKPAGYPTWTEVTAHVHISTAQEYTGIAPDTRSTLFVASNPPAETTTPLTAGAGYAIYWRYYVTTDAGENYFFAHGNGTKRAILYRAADGSLEYYDTANRDIVGYDQTFDAWTSFELCNINFAAGTYDIWYNGAVIKTGADMQTTANSANILDFYGAAVQAAYFDNVIVRKFTATEPTWGSWGSEELVYLAPRGFYPNILAH